MTDLEQRVTERLEALRQEIVANIEQKGITASGRTQRSLQVVQYNGGVKLIAAAGNRAPIPTLEVGRPAGNVPGGFRTTKDGTRDVSNTFKWILVQWAAEKGIPDFGWGNATIVGRRIAEQGTLRHSNPEDVYSTAVQKAAEDIRGMIMTTLRETIKNNF